MSSRHQSLYKHVISVTQIYLGPAAERFINRQILNHLNKEPEDLSGKDLKKLLLWIKNAISLLTEDTDLVEEYIKKLENLIAASDNYNGSK